MMIDSTYIRNFAIIAHVDHGKSTLADRFLELTGVIKEGQHEEQFLDRNPISRERGITIKLAPVRMLYRLTSSRVNELNNNIQPINPLTEKRNNDSYILNLIDTPGHVDFSYEVDRTLACVEGVILLVDATQGVQAQTVSNTYKAIEKNLVIIPVVNKIDLPNAEIKATKQQLMDLLGEKAEEVFEISAKTGQGVQVLLNAVIKKIPSPNEEARYPVFHSDGRARPIQKSAPAPSKSLKTNIFAFSKRSLIFDSYYDQHRGVIAFVKVFQGEFRQGQKVRLFQAQQNFEIAEVGIFKPNLTKADSLSVGEMGYVITNLKDIHQVKVGDTLTDEKNITSPLPGYKRVKPMVYASIFSTDFNNYPNLKKALEKLYLNDSSLEFSPVHSQALGAGFRVGFLGLLHADVVRERLEREYNLSLVLTPPQVEFKKENNRFLEPYVKIMIITPSQYLATVMKLLKDHRGDFITMDNKVQLSLIYEMPMSEMISDFYDSLKNVSSGYASLDWEFLRYQLVDADKLIILLNTIEVEEFSEIVVKERAFEKAQLIVKKLRKLIPRQQYEVKIQAKFKGKIIASERISPFRKDVTQKLYGGDRTRKDKLLKKQKEGKKKMKMIGRVEIPKEAFMKLFTKN